MNDFYLPEKFSGLADTPREFIDGAGQPSYIVYPQQFPVGEEKAWTFDDGFWQRAKVTIWVLPISGLVTGAVKGVVTAGKFVVKLVPGGSRVVAGIERGVNSGLRRMGRAAVAMERQTIYIAGKGVSRMALFKKWGNERAAGFLSAKYSERLLSQPIQALDDLIDVQKVRRLGLDEQVVRREVEALGMGWKTADDDIAVSVLNVLKDSHLKDPLLLGLKDSEIAATNKVLGRIGTVGAITWGLTELLAARHACEGELYEPKNGELVLQKALACDTLQTLPLRGFDVAKGADGNEFPVQKAIVLGKEQGFIAGLVGANAPTPLYFASPCRADLTVQSGEVSCTSYEYANGAAVCVGAEVIEPESDLPSCGFDAYQYDRVSFPVGPYQSGEVKAPRSARIPFSYDAVTREKEVVTYNGPEALASELNAFRRISHIRSPLDLSATYSNFAFKEFDIRDTGNVFRGGDALFGIYTADFTIGGTAIPTGFQCLSADEAIDVHPSQGTAEDLADFLFCEDDRSRDDDEGGIGNEGNLLGGAMGNTESHIEFLIEKESGSVQSISYDTFDAAPRVNRAGRYRVSFTDVTHDGRWDGLILERYTTTPLGGDTDGDLIAVLDEDGDGTVDSVRSILADGCKVPGLITTVEKDSGESPNFCYTTVSVWKEAGWRAALAAGIALEFTTTRGVGSHVIRTVATRLTQGTLAWITSVSLNDWPG
ncbi:MAG: hypothetical protein HY520_00745 [Candidatus Aenigmarchaeota archaeon]|nr:hypothetical protein [Candidatus Aenigmarchaeota archaeon]